MSNGLPEPAESSVNRGIQIALGFTVVGSLVLWIAWGFPFALGWLAGGVWNVFNIFLLCRLMALLDDNQAHRGKRAALWLTLKFGILYPLGVLILWTKAVNLVGFVIGFTVVLAVVAGMFVLQRKVKISHV